MNWPIDVFDQALADARDFAAAARGHPPASRSLLLGEIDEAAAQKDAAFRHWWHGR